MEKRTLPGGYRPRAVELKGGSQKVSQSSVPVGACAAVVGSVVAGAATDAFGVNRLTFVARFGLRRS